MEEKVLIKSYSSKRTKRFFIGFIIGLFAMSLIFLILGIELGKYYWAWFNRDYAYSGQYRCEFCRESGYEDEIISHILSNHRNEIGVFDYVSYGLVFFILHWVFFLGGGIAYLIYFSLSRCNIVVTDKNITGKTFGGKKVVLPIHMISAYSISKFFSVIAVTTASGLIKFHCIGNYKEIADVLQQLLNERQERTETQENAISKQSSSKNLDDLMKLKNLLDNDIITQEEFNAKKKELLGL